MIADACSIACNKIYNLETKQWEDNGTREPTQFITTEQEEDEIQTMMLAFLSAVDEEHILNNTYVGDEYERVIKAAKILADSPLYIKKLPDFSLQDIENTIKFGINQYGIRYLFFDYIHSSMKILSEISSKAGIKGLREDNILFMIGVRLKDLCVQYGIFIMSATQLNGNYTNADIYDQNLLRGAKSLGDKIDLGMIMLQVSSDDREALLPTVSKLGIQMPDIKIAIYKNRRGRYKDILLWCKSNRGICRIDPIFVTNYNYELMDIEDLKIKVIPKIEASAF
jgi:replicative DNA helicase